MGAALVDDGAASVGAGSGAGSDGGAPSRQRVPPPAMQPTPAATAHGAAITEMMAMLQISPQSSSLPLGVVQAP